MKNAQCVGYQNAGSFMPEETLLPLIKGRKNISKYLMEKWGISMGLYKNNSLERKYGLPIKIIFGRIYTSPESLDQWAKHAIEGEIIPFALKKEYCKRNKIKKPGRPKKIGRKKSKWYKKKKKPIGRPRKTEEEKQKTIEKRKRKKARLAKSRKEQRKKRKEKLKPKTKLRRIKKKLTTADIYDKDWRKIRDIYEPFNPKIWEAWRKITYDIAKTKVSPYLVFRKIILGMIEEAGCKIALRHYRPILTKPEDVIPAHEKEWPKNKRLLRARKCVLEDLEEMRLIEEEGGG